LAKKLIRDSLADVIKHDKVRVFKDIEEYETLLKNKLIEELDELKESEYTDVTEYADVFEVLETLAEYFGNITFADIREEQLLKVKERGGFTSGVVYTYDGDTIQPFEDKIKQMTKDNPNDMELGNKIRELMLNETKV
jgi:predicted house-cleaning noncanonical NTP pyrophosphatase (MazG superfamily)|tara:strand:- start:2748 stop:3161 length:414 start_codon:yes stop_codon:yes gene_type:complete